MTYFWYKLLKQKRRTVWFPADRICALHQQDACRYGVECKHVHLCRDLYTDMVAQVGPTLLANAVAMLAGEVPLAEPQLDPPASQAKVHPRASKAIPILDPVSGTEITVPKPAGQKGPTLEESTSPITPSEPTSSSALSPAPPTLWGPISLLPPMDPFMAFTDHPIQKLPQASPSLDRPPSESAEEGKPSGTRVAPSSRHSPPPEDDAGNRLFPKPGKKKAVKKVEDNMSPREHREHAAAPADAEWARKMEASRGRFKGLRETALLGIEVLPVPASSRPGFGAGRGRLLAPPPM